MVELVLYAIYCSAAVGVLSCLISESALLAPIRKKLINFHLIFCPICTSFWFAAPFLMIGPLFYFAVVGFSNIWILIILHTYEALDRTYDDASEKVSK